MNKFRPGSFWLVIYECRYTIVKVTPSGRGFFAFGQDAIWHFTEAEWIREIEIPEIQNEQN